MSIPTANNGVAPEADHIGNSDAASRKTKFVVLGAGVVGLTTALVLKEKYPQIPVTVVAKHVPGDFDISYASPWAGASWLSVATDNGRQEDWDRRSFLRFQELSTRPETGVQRMSIRAVFDNPKELAGVLSQETGKIWYENLVGGLEQIPDEELPKGSKFGFDASTFVINVDKYLPLLQQDAQLLGVVVESKSFDHVNDVFQSYRDATAVFNCTGIGSYSLGGVEDKAVYPTLGQVMLVESPAIPLGKMYFRSPKRVANDTTYIFPRGDRDGVILGGCRIDGQWEGVVNMDFAEDIKRRCCALCPALGRPEDLKVVRHGVGLRPSRKGGARIEKELVDPFRDGSQRLIIHNYGAGGAGYQASWGMALEAVTLLTDHIPNLNVN